MDNLLKEAIADARQVKQLAAENARLQLEEAFRPHISSMVSSHLRKLNEDNDDSSGIGGGTVTVKNPGPTKPSKAASDSSHIEDAGLEVEDVLDGTTKFSERKVNEADFGAEPEFGEEEGTDIDITTPSGGQLDISAPPGGLDLGTGASDMGGGEFGGVGGVGQGAPQGGGFDEFGAGSPDELDLEAIIRELELDSQGDMGVEDPFAAQAPDPAAQAPKMESFQDPQAGKKVSGPMDGSVKVNETLAGSGDEGVFKDGKKLANADGVPGGKKVTPGQAVTGTKAERMSESEEIDLDEILREIAMEEESAVDETAKVVEENTALRTKLKEAYDVVRFLKKTVNEQSVLNAQLMFTNKIFRNFDLKLEQKKNIIAAFDRANSLREVKIVYTTIAESFKSKSTKTTSAKAITEGMASRPTGSTAKKSTQILEEGNAQVARMQRLAGIIKS